MGIDLFSNPTFWGGVVVGLLPAAVIIVSILFLREGQRNGH